MVPYTIVRAFINAQLRVKNYGLNLALFYMNCCNSASEASIGTKPPPFCSPFNDDLSSTHGFILRQR